MSKHTPEPWRIHKGHSGYAQFPADVVIESAADEEWCVAIAIGDVRAVPSEANAARIVACVNACAGMSDPAEEIARLREHLQMLRDSYSRIGDDHRALCAERDALRAERDALREALREIAMAGMTAPRQMTEQETKAFQARRAYEFIGIAANALRSQP